MRSRRTDRRNIKTMNKGPVCLICNSEDVSAFPAGMTDFMTERIDFQREEHKISMIHCNNCGFSWFDYRLSDEEAEKCYSGYRNDLYQKQRQKHEKWYTEKINDQIGKNKTEIKNRKKNLGSIINEACIDLSGIRSALDYGGDTGVYFPDIFENIPKTVFEVSGVKPVENVRLVDDVEELKKEKFDFVMCCHVLEHVNSPAEMMETIRSLISPEGYCYIELPFDSPFYTSPFSKLQFLFNRYFITNPAALFQQFKDSFKRSDGYQMSEHINYFTPEAVQLLMSRSGLDILSVRTRNINFGWCVSRVISVLAKAK